MNDLWTWISESVDHFREGGDRRRFEIASQYFQATQCMSTSPSQALAHLEHARSLADRFDEPWWSMLCEHWRSQTFLHRTRNIDAALHVASDAIATIESDKRLKAFPQRVCLRDDQVSALQMIDPDGYANEISQGCEYIETEGADLEGCQHCLRGIRIDSLIHEGSLDLAQELALSSLKLCVTRQSGHYTSQYYSALCQIANLREEWDQLEHWARAGSIFYGTMGSDISNIELLMWHANALRRTGKPDAALNAYRKARKAQRTSPFGQSSGFFDALAGYHEANEDWLLALVARTMELKNTAGAPYVECVCRLHRIRLLRLTGQPTDAEVAAIREAAGSLRIPDIILNRLESLIGPEEATA